MKSALSLLLATGLFVASGRAQNAAQQPTFRAETLVVNTDVSVHRANAAVAGLTAGDFQVFDNGVEQKIESQAIEDVPIDVSLIFDLSFQSAVRMNSAFASDLQKVIGLLRPGDRVRVLTSATEVHELVPMRLASIPFQPEESDGVTVSGPLHELERAPSSGSSIMDALFLAMSWPAQVGRRHLIAALSTGFDGDSVLDTEMLTSIAEHSDALLQVVLRPPFQASRGGTAPAVPLRFQAWRRAITEAAITTGGEAHVTVDHLGAFKSIFAEFKQSYVLRYTLTGVAPQGWHTIVVKVPKSKDYTIRTRAGYFGR
jgi:hypothetical protein